MRFERMTYRLEGGCSIQLSYQGIFLKLFNFDTLLVFTNWLAELVYFVLTKSNRTTILSYKIFPASIYLK